MSTPLENNDLGVRVRVGRVDMGSWQDRAGLRTDGVVGEHDVF